MANVIGLDLGQAQDYTALCVARAEARPTGRTVHRDLDALAVAWGYTARPPARVPELALAFEVVHLERYPLGTSYVDIARDVGEMAAWLAAPPSQYVRRDPPRHLRGFARASLTTATVEPDAPPPPPRPTLAIDGTGLGAAVADLFRATEVDAELVPVTITGGFEARTEGGKWFVPKADLIGELRVLLDDGRLSWAAGLAEAATLEAELRDYRVRVTPGLREGYDARQGAHDDLVLAVAIACWAGQHAFPTPLEDW